MPAIVGLWVPVVVCSHLFAAAWLLQTLLLGRSSLFKRGVKKAGGRKSLDGRRSVDGGGHKGRRSADVPGTAARAAGHIAAVASVRPGKTVVATAASRAAAAPAAADACDADVERGTRDQDHRGTRNQDQAAGPASPFEDPRHMSNSVLSDGSDDAPPVDDVPDNSPTACATLRQHLSVAPDVLTMEWQDMGCSYSHHGVTKVVLQGIWGRASPGEMQALMGPSGAGKSTFMDLIAMRKSVGNLTGRLLVKGRPADKSFIRKTAYVPQEDNFVPTMTAKETLDFYAKVTLPSSFSKARRHERVAEVMDAVGLSHARKTMVGGSLPGGLMLRGLSGGERKRLSIAAGILAAPAVLFLDEPTSGLDSFAALSVMGHLQRMARVAEHIVISTIHQPRVAIWQMFDMVTLLANGRLMFHGPREDLTPWFDSLGYTHDPDRDGVASDWCLDLVAVGFAKPEKFYGRTMRTRDDLASAAALFLEHYMAECRPTLPGKHHGGVPRSASVEKALALASAGSVRDISTKASSTYATGPWAQFVSLLRREFVLVTRNPFDVAARCLTFTWVAIFIGLLYYALPTDGSSLRSRLNLCFVSLCFVVQMPYISMGLYTADKKFYLADASAKLYRPLAYYLAKVAVTTPFQVICSLSFAWTLYGMAGMRVGADHIFKYGVVVTLVYLIAVQVLHCAAILAPNQDAAFMLSLVWTVIQLLLSAFFVVFNDVTFNYWLTQLRYINAVYFGFEALVINEFHGLRLDCSGGLGADYTSFILTAFPNMSNAQKSIVNQMMKPQQGCVVDTNAVISYFNFGRPYWASAIILVGYLLVMHAATFAAMLLSARHEAR